jgi:hypothetical protein
MNNYTVFQTNPASRLFRPPKINRNFYYVGEYKPQDSEIFNRPIMGSGRYPSLTKPRVYDNEIYDDFKDFYNSVGKDVYGEERLAKWGWYRTTRALTSDEKRKHKKRLIERRKNENVIDADIIGEYEEPDEPNVDDLEEGVREDIPDSKEQFFLDEKHNTYPQGDYLEETKKSEEDEEDALDFLEREENQKSKELVEILNDQIDKYENDGKLEELKNIFLENGEEKLVTYLIENNKKNDGAFIEEIQDDDQDDDQPGDLSHLLDEYKKDGIVPYDEDALDILEREDNKKSEEDDEDALDILEREDNKKSNELVEILNDQIDKYENDGKLDDLKNILVENGEEQLVTYLIENDKKNNGAFIEEIQDDDQHGDSRVDHWSTEEPIIGRPKELKYKLHKRRDGTYDVFLVEDEKEKVLEEDVERAEASDPQFYNNNSGDEKIMSSVVGQSDNNQIVSMRSSRRNIGDRGTSDQKFIEHVMDGDEKKVLPSYRPADKKTPTRLVESNTEPLKYISKKITDTKSPDKRNDFMTLVNLLKNLEQKNILLKEHEITPVLREMKSILRTDKMKVNPIKNLRLLCKYITDQIISYRKTYGKKYFPKLRKCLRNLLRKMKNRAVKPKKKK